MQFGSRPSFSLNFKQNTMLIKLIYINLAVFIGAKLLYLPFVLMKSTVNPQEWVYKWLALPSDLGSLLIKPWTLITYMFLHWDLWHLFSNMLWLYFLGQLFSQIIGERKLLTVYIAGGIAGGLLYVAFFNLFPAFEVVKSSAIAIGASASVMAVVIGVGTYAPNFEIQLLLFGKIKLKYIAAVSFILDVISISNSNSGGHIAHIGGALLGFFYAKQALQGKDITSWVGSSINFTAAIFSKSDKSKMKVKYKKPPTDNYEYNSRKKEEQAVIDSILDKISKSGYDSLSKKEKEILFKASKN